MDLKLTPPSLTGVPVETFRNFTSPVTLAEIIPTKKSPGSPGNRFDVVKPMQSLRQLMRASQEDVVSKREIIRKSQSVVASSKYVSILKKKDTNATSQKTIQSKKSVKFSTKKTVYKYSPYS